MSECTHSPTVRTFEALHQCPLCLAAQLAEAKRLLLMLYDNEAETDGTAINDRIVKFLRGRSHE